MEPNELKLIVQDKYGKIANQPKVFNEKSCCGGTNCCESVDFKIFSENYSDIDGYVQDADLGLGCGIPTHFAAIKKGDHILDLGSGAGNDCFVARSLTGESGKVTGIDFTDEMIEKANTNLQKTGFKNIEFVKGDIENMPLPSGTFDVVISNCVLNLVPDKKKAYSEIYRVLKKGGHFCISDVVLNGILPEKIKTAAEMYVGCVSGALQQEDYIDIIQQSGFIKIVVDKENRVNIPDDILRNYLSTKEIEMVKKSGMGINSLTISAKK